MPSTPFSRQKPDTPSVPSLTRATIRFPRDWNWLVDEAIPSLVKQKYSPKESWKNKPFTADDGRFFFRGVEELSELFTEERPRRLPAYFQHPKFRSGYLLYFLPLQASKFVSLFRLQPKPIHAALAFGRKTGTLRVADLGAGPGTASLALLLVLAEEKDLPPIELHWLDTSRAILEDGRDLLLRAVEKIPPLRGKVTVHLHAQPWWKAPSLIPDKTSLILMGNVLNEGSTEGSSAGSRRPSPELDLPDEDENTRELTPRREAPPIWSQLLDKAAGGGILIVEPATRKNSQLLSGLRDVLIESGLLEDSPASIWGPCLHTGTCPLGGGKDWCHFSVPITIPGRWFAQFSRGLGSERQFAKFSYLWLASGDHRAPIPSPDLRRVISDPLKARGNRDDFGQVLLCEPETPGRFTLRSSRPVWRGDVIELNAPAMRVFSARPPISKKGR